MDLDDDGWEDMPIIRSEPNALGLDKEDEKKYHYKPSIAKDPTETVVTGNAAGTSLNYQDVAEGQSWRSKLEGDESDYTRLRLEEDTDADEVHMRTRYLFDDTQAMTPLSQMQATKNLLTETQRIAYVGLCKLACQEMTEELRKVAASDGKGGVKGATVKARLKEVAGKGKSGKEEEEEASVEACKVWGLKIMARLYHHMELAREEQQMIESLAAHGVDAMDLVPSLMATHTVPNPEYDPKEAARVAKEDEEKQQQEREQAEREEEEGPPPPQYSETDASLQTGGGERAGIEKEEASAFGQEEDDEPSPFDSPPTPKAKSNRLALPPEDSGGDIGSLGEDDDPFGGLSRPSPPSPPLRSSSPSTPTPTLSSSKNLPPLNDSSNSSHPPSSMTPPPSASSELPSESDSSPPKPTGPVVGTTTVLDAPVRPEDEDVTPVLPGVSTTLTPADESITLDIRWTILCDLFLALISDSVYDARSRVLLERVASKLNLGLLDVVRFEKRVTDSLEIQEGVEKMEQTEVIEGRQKLGKKKRMVAIGLATLGGGLVIGLSAGLLAPVIGAALGGALTTVGITGTTAFLGGAGGAAAITTGGVLTGSKIASKGMARRTQYVRVFELRSLHNQKRVNCFITMPGFMAGKDDDVRLPFSTLDPMIGDVYTTFWEPEMMEEMGNALRILTSEVLTTVGQTVLSATVLTAVLSALQWPLILTKLSYLIDNPWSNALDRAKAAGLVLADTLINRHVGVRPVSLIGFSLGARAIFYALAELARCKAYGIVQDVYIFGGTITANKKTWLEVRSVVAGRLVNGFARNDWVLGYLFRATAAGNTVAGLRPVEGIPGLENVDVTDKIAGHLSYRPMMPLLLHTVGLPVTADYFDEPEEPEFFEDRIVMTEEEEAALKEKKSKRWFSRSTSSSKKPSPASSSPSSRKASSSETRAPSGNVPEYEEGDDDLPPREDGHARATAPPTSPSNTKSSSHLPLPPNASTSAPPEAGNADLDEPLSTLPPKAGFDFSAISAALGKDIDLSTSFPAPATLPSSVASSKPPPLERSESTPFASSSVPSITTTSYGGIGLGRNSLSGQGQTAAATSMEDLSTNASRSLSLGNGFSSSNPSFSSSSSSPTSRTTDPFTTSSTSDAYPSWSNPYSTTSPSHLKESSSPSYTSYSSPWSSVAQPTSRTSPSASSSAAHAHRLSFAAADPFSDDSPTSYSSPNRKTSFALGGADDGDLGSFGGDDDDGDMGEGGGGGGWGKPYGKPGAAASKASVLENPWG